MTEDLPPVYIYSGPLAGQGEGDQAIRFLADRLPGYRHEVVRADTARIFYEMEHKDGICYWGAWRTVEREQFAAFSDRPLLGAPFRIVAAIDRLPSLAPYIGADGAVDLAALSSDRRMTGGYVLQQPYPGVIGAFIRDPARSVRLDAVTQVAQLYGLLRAGRVDFIIGNGVETNYYLPAAGTRAEFRAVPVKDGPAAAVAYVACSKKATGSVIIAKINRILADDAVWARYLAPLRRWTDPADYAAALAAKPEARTD